MNFIQARHYTKTGGRGIDLQVIHSMEAPEKETTAEAVANYFKNTSTKASAHYCYDNDSEVQCVYDKDIAYAAPGANHNGLHHELAGYARQDGDEWQDRFSISMLARAAINVYAKAVEFDIPIVALGVEGVKVGRRGITTHAVISKAFQRSTHTDPGPSFPMSRFIEMVKAVPLLSTTPAPKGGQPIMLNCVDAIVCPLDGGLQKLQKDGGIFNDRGCQHYHGSYPGLNLGDNPPVEFSSMVRIPGTTGYILVAINGNLYDFAGDR